MNPIERDLRNYFGVDYGSEGDILEHYGTKRHSGRPWNLVLDSNNTYPYLQSQSYYELIFANQYNPF